MTNASDKHLHLILYLNVLHQNDIIDESNSKNEKIVSLVVILCKEMIVHTVRFLLDSEDVQTVINIPQ